MADLKEKTAAELREMAKELGITGRWSMTKDQLVKKVEERLESKEEKAEAKKSPESKEKYILEMAKGTICAINVKHKDGKSRVISAAMENISKSRRAIKLVTAYGAEHVVSFDDIVWVRTGRRWPRGVYELLTARRESEKADEK